MKYDKKKILELYSEEKTKTEIAKQYAKQEGFEYNDTARRKVSEIINALGETTSEDYIHWENNIILPDMENETITETNQYNNFKHKPLTALDEEGKLLSISRYCEVHNLEIDKIRSWKLVSHTGIPYYNIAFYETVIEPQVTEEELKTLIEQGLKNIKYRPLKSSGKKTGVAKIADLHFGSYVDNLIRTKNFSIDILASKLINAANEINNRNYEKVHIHILGDLIESFTGLNHKNSWKGLEKGMVGAEAVKLCCKVLHKDFLSRINNLGEVKIVAGNHDRSTSDNKEDVKGEAADLIGWGLELIGYSVEFNPLVITHEVDGICHIIEHGHHGLSKKSTQQICWDYGIQGKFNLICEGHLHSIIEKLSVSQREKFRTIKDDSVDHRRMNCPSFFTGNFFSEALGYTSQSGFVITEDNGQGVPNVFYYAV